MNNNRGIFILFEGIDKSGKSTQSKLLVEYLNSINRPTKLFTFPNRTTDIGKLISKDLKKETYSPHTSHLLFSANKWEFKEELENTLNNGVNIVVDRYVYSGVIYALARDLDPFWAAHCYKGLLSPDVVFFLDLDIEELNKRKNFGEERFEKLEIQEKVQKGMKLLSKDLHWITIKCDKSIEEIHEILKVKVLDIIDDEREPLDFLDYWIDIYSMICVIK